MTKRIEKLTLKGFRGSTQRVEIEFDKDRPIIVIFGENGTGKSSIADAIDFVCNGQIGSLAARSLGGPNKNQYAPAQGSNPKQLEVGLLFGGEQWTGRLAANKADIRGAASAVRPRAQVLRRVDIVKIMEAAGADRYQQLQAFISAPQVEQGENNLREACKAARQEFDEASRVLTEAQSALANIWVAEGSVGVNALAWARARTQIEPEELQQAERQLMSALTAIDSAKASLDSLDASEVQLRSTQTERQTAEAKLADALTQDRKQNPALVQLLQDAQTFLADRAQLDECPLCGQAADAEQLRLRVMAQLEAMKTLMALTQQRARLTQQAGKAEAVVEDRRAEAKGAARVLANMLAVFDDEWKREARHLLPADPAELLPALHELMQAALSAREKLSADRDQINKVLGSFSSLKQALKTIDAKTDAAKQLQRIASRLNEVLQVIEAERKAYSDEVLVQIGSTVDGLYARIHPNEPLGDFRFRMKPNVKGSVESDARFGDDVGLPAGAYYSEAHLDTLGLCVYLALAKHSADSNYIIVLDDVLTSVDDAHLQRVMELIHAEAAHFGQLIITTHFRPWRDRYLLGRFEQSKVQLIELAEWSKQHGIRPRKTKLSAEELRTHLDAADFDRQVVASKAGILLEGLLDMLAMRYRCKVPRKPDANYTLGELLDAFDNKLKKVMKLEILDAQGVASLMEVNPMLEGLQALAWIRNQVGAHFNVGGQQIPDADVRLFAQRALALADALICETCGAVPSKNNTGSYWECGCKTNKRRLYPLASPGQSAAAAE